MTNIFTKDIAILDVTSRLISAIVGVKKAQSVFGVKAIIEKENSGFENGEWFDKEDTISVATAVLKEAMQTAESSTKKLFIGVPAEFIATVTKPVSITLDRERRVVDADINFLIEKGNTFNSDNHVLINSAPVEFSVDASDKTYRDVRGLTASSVQGTVSYMLCEKSFVDMFDEVGNSLGFKEIKFVSTAWAEGISLFEKEERDDVYVLVDIGFISSSVLIGRGEGVIDLKSFSLGGGHISGDMCEALDVSFDLAEKARELVDLNLNYADDAILVADQEDVIYGTEACEVVRCRLDDIADIVKGVIDASGIDFPSYAPVYLTGEGIASIRGAKKYLSNELGMNVEIITPKVPGYVKPANASKISLLQVAETLSKQSFGSFIKRLFNGGII